MRSIVGKKDSNRLKQLLLGLILIFVMVLSVIGYGLNSDKEQSSNKINYMGFEFINQNNYWVLNIGEEKSPKLLVFRYNPYEVEEVDTNLTSIENYYSKPLYYSSESSEAVIEIERNLFYQTNVIKRIQPACIANESCQGDWATKTCEDNFIIIKEDYESSITQNKNCVYIKGPQENLTLLTDEFLFKILGIIE